MKPNESNTKAEIKAYLDEQGIAYDDDANKATLLGLIPNDETDEEEPLPDLVPELPPVKEPLRFTKWQLMYQSSFNPRQKELFKLALEDNVPYTMDEAWALVEEFIESLWW